MDVDGQAETQQPARSFVLPWELNYNDGKFHCSVCNKTFSKDTVFKSHLGSPKHKTAETKYEQTIESISKLEFLINRLGDLLADAIVATKENIQKKQARRHDEDIMDDEDELEMPDLDEEIEEVRLTKKFYPVGWDGNPIPFWYVSALLWGRVVF
jgi:splicing factor 3A subunit 3